MLGHLLFPVLLFQPAPQEVEGKALASVSGPMAPRWPDLAGGLGDGIQMSLRKSARKGSIPAVALPEGPVEVRDAIRAIPGWKAYRIEVQPFAKVKARLRGAHEAWFRVQTLNKWGEMEAGMLGNRIPTGNPEATYSNPKGHSNAVFFVVDTTDLGADGEAYSLVITYH